MTGSQVWNAKNVGIPTGGNQEHSFIKHVYTHAHAHARTHPRTHARAHALTRARPHAHTHTHTHTHALGLTPIPECSQHLSLAKHEEWGRRTLYLCVCVCVCERLSKQEEEDQRAV